MGREEKKLMSGMLQKLLVNLLIRGVFDWALPEQSGRSRPLPTLFQPSAESVKLALVGRGACTRSLFWKRLEEPN